MLIHTCILIQSKVVPYQAYMSMIFGDLGGNLTKFTINEILSLHVPCGWKQLTGESPPDYARCVLACWWFPRCMQWRGHPHCPLALVQTQLAVLSSPVNEGQK